MAKQDLSHEEVWDDSALVTSWNEALEEYKKYHSLAAKGEKVDVVLDKAETGVLDDDEQHSLKAEAQVEDKAQQLETNGNVEHAPPQAQAVAGAEFPHAQAPPAGMPQALLNNMQDDGLKNLMMSWYYAGYYTGLHEGKQKA